jgi:signal transduction histidine kinase
MTRFAHLKIWYYFYSELKNSDITFLPYFILRNQYRYKLDGYDHRWNHAGNRGLATYTKVPPGSYRFRVKALGHYGAAAPEQTLRIVILPPWWRTWWAYAGYGGLVAAALLPARREVVKRGRLRGDLRMEQVESEKWQELDTLKSRFFANISHEFRTPLTLIAGTVDNLLGEDQKRRRLPAAARTHPAQRPAAVAAHQPTAGPVEAGGGPAAPRRPAWQPDGLPANDRAGIRLPGRQPGHRVRDAPARKGLPGPL